MKKQTNQPSIRTKVIDAITAAKEIKLADLRKVFPNIKVSRISVALWNLKKAGVITHNLKTGVYSLTPVNKKEAEPVEQPKAEPKVAPAVKRSNCTSLNVMPSTGKKLQRCAWK